MAFKHYVTIICVELIKLLSLSYSWDYLTSLIPIVLPIFFFPLQISKHLNSVTTKIPFGPIVWIVLQLFYE